MKDLILLEKKIIMDKSKVLLDYKPDENWRDYWMQMDGTWEYKDGYLIGTEPRNRGGILFSKERYEQNVMISFTGGTVLPATRDVNAIVCAEWNNEINRMGNAYICGLNGWYENKCGIERNRYSNLYSTTTSFKYVPGTEVRMDFGAIDGHCFMFVDGQLVTELRDPNPIKGGYVGFSPFSTRMKVKDIQIREIYWEPYEQSYEPEFE